MVVKNSLLTLGGLRGVSAGRKEGFALPIAIALGLVMIAFAGTSILVAQGDRNNAVQRRASGASILVSDGAVSRALVQLSNPNNGVLLNRNYDPIDPKTGRNYLGPDGKPKSGDETATALDEWTSYNPSGAPCFQQLGWAAPNIALTGTLGTAETYTIRAYRYDEQEQVGTLLVEGSYQGQSSLVAISLMIEPVMDDFPSILISQNYANGSHGEGKLILRGRFITGRKGNVYYPPNTSANSTLTGISAPGDLNRSDYLNAIYSSTTQDGATADTVSGKIFACRLRPNWPISQQGTNLGNINSSTTITGNTGGITHYQVNTINLSHNHSLTVDTTAGPVYLYINGNGTVDQNMVNLYHTSKIINIRTDGQPPKVGDFRIISQNHSHIALYGQSCIQDAFLYFPIDGISFLTDGGGCPVANNSNFVGVAWVEAIKSSKNNSANRVVATPDSNLLFNTTVIPGITSGITVPDNLDSLVDLLEYVNWPVQYKYVAIKNWRRVN
jgi:hypothetical protein